LHWIGKTPTLAETAAEAATAAAAGKKHETPFSKQ